MWSGALLNLFVLPFLLLLSIPLILSAAVTAFLALTVLFLRALVVYFELSIALLANFFLFTAHSPASGSLLALSRVTTPGIDRSPVRMKHGHPFYQNSEANSSHAKSRRGSWNSKEVVLEDYFFHNNNHTGPTFMSSHEVLSSFVSGNAERDFEGVGGWRTPLASRKKHLIPSASSVGYHSSEGEVEEDDQAWISINKRLELPSRHFNFAPPTLSPVMASAATIESIEEPPQHHRHHAQLQPQQLQRPRFHRRSVTTPLFSMPSTISVESSHSSSFSADLAPLQTSKSSAGLDSLLSSSFSEPSASHHPLPPSSSLTTTPSWYAPPFLMTPTSFGADYRMVHYPSFISRRRRGSGGSLAAATTAKTTSLTGLGLT